MVTIHGKFIDTQDVDIDVCEDPDDNKFIECALASNCPIIVSGDNHLLKLAGYSGIEVLKPRNFMEKYLK
jgi:predicted nucleic acid-binding protein